MWLSSLSFGVPLPRIAWSTEGLVAVLRVTVDDVITDQIHSRTTPRTPRLEVDALFGCSAVGCVVSSLGGGGSLPLRPMDRAR